MEHRFALNCPMCGYRLIVRSIVNKELRKRQYFPFCKHCEFTTIQPFNTKKAIKDYLLHKYSFLYNNIETR